MDSTLRSRALAAMLLLAFGLARAANHDSPAPPTRPGPFSVACSNVELDMARLDAIGGQPSDYWEGAEVAGAHRYITEVLSHPEAAVIYRAQVPLKVGMYPTLFGRSVEFAAIVCYPTPRSNPDPDYAIPVQGGVVPHMQQPGVAPRLISADEFAQTVGQALPLGAEPKQLPLLVFSHGLGGSPLGSGYIDVLKALAAQGYMVGAVFHADNRYSKVRIENLADLAFALAFFPSVVEMQALRPLALKAMTDALLANPGYAQGIDRTRIGGFGASLGGEAMIHLLGGRITASLTKACDDPVYDPRLRAAVGYVPYAGQSFLPAFCEGQSGARFVDRPFLAISGTADTTAPLTQAKQAVNNMTGSRYMVELAGGQHELAVANVPDVLTWTVDFLNAYLEVPWDSSATARFIRMNSVAGNGPDSLTVDAHVPATANAGEVRVMEFYDAARDRYVLAAGEGDIASKSQAGLEALDLGFRGLANATANSVAGCRYGDGFGNAFTGVGGFECGFLSRARGLQPVDHPFDLLAPGADGRCAAGLLEVSRAWAPTPAGRGLVASLAGMRLTTSASELAQLAGSGWAVQPNAVGCAAF